MVDATLAAVSKYCEINVYTTFQGPKFHCKAFKIFAGIFCGVFTLYIEMLYSTPPFWKKMLVYT